MMYLSIVAPCMNEEEVLEEFYLRVSAVIREMKISDYEIILVDDGSRDKTWEIIEALNKRNTKVKGIQLSRNFGHQSALAAGLHEAEGELVFIIDSDLQDPPELLKVMVGKMNEGFDVVYGQRRHRRGETKFKLWSASLFYKFLSMLADIDIPRD
ncbi:MAG: glycosyltransferase family 2 protein, partial [Bacteriovoracia bacterium]